MSTELFLHVPAASIALLSEEQHEPYMQKLQDLPQKTRDTATSVKVAAYIRGLVKSHRLPEAHGPIIAQNLFRVLIAEYPLAQMPAHLSSETGIANDVAQRIATEIEKDVLAPIALELNKHTSQAQKNTSSMASKLQQPARPAPPNVPSKFPRTPSSPSNILNLKEEKKPPQPPFVP